MVEFEFKMLGIANYVDRGHYLQAYTTLNQLHKQLLSRDGLVKVPKFANKKEELDFYLSLQNPRTGAFMDDTYPLFTYFDPTVNMVTKLAGLAKETGQPLHLKYPLKFLDQINTAEKLNGYLDDLSTVGWIGSKLPKTPYVTAAQTINYTEFETNKLYSFSPEWKQALLKWFYDNQVSETGFWGSKLRGSGKLLKSGDLGPTFHIVKLFVDDQGNTIHSEFPLRYKDKMFANTLQKLSEPMPGDADLAEIHDWSLTRYQGIKLLTNYVWNGASTEEKNKARSLIEDLLKTKYEKFFVKRQGGFSLYPGASDADLDGTGEVVSLLDVIGAFDRVKQERLWGLPEKNIADLGVHDVSELRASDYSTIKELKDVNSIRLYSTDPTDKSYLSNVVGIVYPKETPVQDIMDLLPKVTRWSDSTSQTMGNWTPKEEIQQELAILTTQPVSVVKGDIPIDLTEDVLRNNKELVVIGFDMLQIPKYKLKLRMK